MAIALWKACNLIAIKNYIRLCPEIGMWKIQLEFTTRNGDIGT